MNAGVNMFKILSIIAMLTVSMTTYADRVKPLYIVHVQLGNNQLSQNIEKELLRSSELIQNRPVVFLRPNLDVQENPFAVSRWSHQLGLTRTDDQIKDEYTPLFTPKMVSWFEDLEAKGIRPEIFIINGHHLVGMGFQSDGSWETKYKNQFNQTIELANRSLYLQTIIKSSHAFPVIKRFFEGIKLAFVGGCEGLSNLEPKEFGDRGRALTPAEIKAKIQSGQKSLMLGDIAKRTGLAYYKYDLAKTYPGDFTLKESEEVCLDKVNRLHCEVYYVHRILPDSGLWDGKHLYNMPYQMKKLFPKALAVFGFNTPSPLSPGPIWQATFNEARSSAGLNNVLSPLLSDEVSTADKKQILQKIRIAWTKSTYRLNKKYHGDKLVNRVSGSITPAFPDMDQNGIFAYADGQSEYAEAPAFAPYEVRSGNESAFVTGTSWRKAEKSQTPKNQDNQLNSTREVNKKDETTKVAADKSVQTVVVKANESYQKVKRKEVNSIKEYNPSESEDPLYDLIKKIELKDQLQKGLKDDSSVQDLDLTK